MIGRPKVQVTPHMVPKPLVVTVSRPVSGIREAQRPDLRVHGRRGRVVPKQSLSTSRGEPFETVGGDGSDVADDGDGDVVRLGEIDLALPSFSAVADLRRRQWQAAAAQAWALRSHADHHDEGL